MSERVDEKYKSHFYKESAAAYIASVSLTYLLCLEQGADSKKVRRRFPLASHSAKYWIYFAHVAKDENMALRTIILQLLSDNKKYTGWLSLHDPDKPWNEEPKSIGRETTATLLHITWRAQLFNERSVGQGRRRHCARRVLRQRSAGCLLRRSYEDGGDAGRQGPRSQRSRRTL